MALIPGMPKISFVALGGLSMFAAWKMKPGGALEPAAAAKGAQAKGAPGTPAVDPMDAVLKLDELMLEVGVGLVPLVDVKQGGQLLVEREIAAQESGATTGIPRPLDSYHRQSVSQGKRVCRLSSRR